MDHCDFDIITLEFIIRSHHMCIAFGVMSQTQDWDHTDTILYNAVI